jgi:hypothetical protein
VSNNILFIGGPGSGKSNYLFRCWIAIEREHERVIKHGLPEELEYLHRGATYLLEGRFAPHTSRDTSSTCRIPVALREPSGKYAELVIPDVSGELWLDLYEKRQWPVAWNELLSPSSGFLLFVQADSPHEVRALDWLTCERYYTDHSQARPQVETPTQVLLVDWLQIVRHIFDRQVGASVIPRLSVVVSAWDRLKGEEASSPSTYLAMRFPMFSDFLSSQAHRFDARLFGVSVASGDLDKDASFRDAYVAADPATQGFSVSRLSHGRLRRDDVLLPVYWALNHDP